MKRHALPLLSAAVTLGLAACTAASDPTPAPHNPVPDPSTQVNSSETATPVASAEPEADGSVEPIRYSIGFYDVLEMDTALFTQGLEYLDDGTVVLSSGQYGESSINVLDINTGEVLHSQPLDNEFFAEGATVVGETVHQITWQEHTVLTWQLPDLTPGPTFSYEGQGWGLCYDDQRDVLWRSDGSALLFAHDPETWEQLDEVLVHREGEVVTQLNELECVDGTIWANIFTTDEVVHIDPESGAVLGFIDLEQIRLDAEDSNDGSFNRNQVLNGLAYDQDRDTFLVTGKQWPLAYILSFDAD